MHEEQDHQKHLADGDGERDHSVQRAKVHKRYSSGDSSEDDEPQEDEQVDLHRDHMARHQ